MTNETLFRQIVDASGVKLSFLAEKMGISYQALLNKMHNKSEFTVFEASVYQSVTHCTNEQRDAIFYTQNVACEATK